ncbi:MAG: phosphoadenosine phosphosulfate reductase family protein [Nanoarchaeales archaeon]
MKVRIISKVFLNENVLEATLKRLEYIFNEFDNIIVSISGGKDSLVLAHLSYLMAQKTNKKIYGLFVDQEAEWNQTIEEIKYIFDNFIDVPIWLQTQFIIHNFFSLDKDWDVAWDFRKKDVWIREMETESYKWEFTRRKPYPLEYYPHKEIFDIATLEIIKRFFNNSGKTVVLVGLRASENVNRYLYISNLKSYKNISYITINKKGFCKAYPIYDWNDRDIWKYIFENNLKYNKIYDYMYAEGIKLNELRVSFLNHGLSFKSLALIKKIDPKLLEKLVIRFDGSQETLDLINYILEFDLPKRFGTWRDFFYYLLNFLDKEYRKEYLKKEESLLNNFKDNRVMEKFYYLMSMSILKGGSLPKDFSEILDSEYKRKKITKERKRVEKILEKKLKIKNE